MKKYITITVGIFVAVFITMFIPSCRKINTIKLSGEWKVTSLSRDYRYKNQRHETSFDGTTKTETYTVTDSAYSQDSTFTYVETKTYIGAIDIDFHNDGTYTYSETFKSDATGVTQTISTEGNWYFPNANHDSGYGVGELLAMQSTKITFNTNSGTIYTTIHEGENTLNFYEMSTLKTSKVVLKMSTSEIINFIEYVTITELTLEPR